AHGKSCRVEILKRIGVADNFRDCFATIPGSGFLMSKYRLVGKAWNHAVAVFARNIFGGENRLNSWMSRDERREISEAKQSEVEGAADDTQSERVHGNFVRTIDFRALNFEFSVQADQTLTNGSAGCRTGGFFRLHMHVENGVDNFPISGTAAEHAADRIHYFGLGRSVIYFEERSGRDQHARSARPALGGAMTKERVLQTVK